MPRITKERLKIAKSRIIRNLDDVIDALDFGGLELEADNKLTSSILTLHKRYYKELNDGQRPALPITQLKQVIHAVVEDHIPLYFTD